MRRGERKWFDRQQAIDDFPQQVKDDERLLALRIAWLDAEYKATQSLPGWRQKLGREATIAMRLYFMARYGHPKGPLANWSR